MATVQRGNGGKLREEALIPLFRRRCLSARRTSSGGAQPGGSGGQDHVGYAEQVGRPSGRPSTLRPRRRPCRCTRAPTLWPDQRGHRGPGRSARRRSPRRAASRCLARAEVGRAVSVFRWAAEDPYLVRGGDAARHRAVAEGRIAYVRRVPQGSGAGDLAVQLPLNLVAHKVAPALAVGPRCCSTRPKTPLSRAAGGDRGGDRPAAMACSAWSWSRTTAPAGLVADPRLPVVSFTGSGPVGHAIQDAVPRKHVVLETGGNAAAVVCADYLPGSATWTGRPPGSRRSAPTRPGSPASASSGSTPTPPCTTTCATAWSRRSAPCAPATRPIRAHIGPMIDEAAARRVESWVQEAVAAGARSSPGTGEVRRTPPPCWRTSRPTAKVMCEEVFGPVLALQRVSGTDEDVRLVNASRYGLQAGSSPTTSAPRSGTASSLVGGVVVGDVPRHRADRCRTAAPRTPAWAARGPLHDGGPDLRRGDGADRLACSWRRRRWEDVARAQREGRRRAPGSTGSIGTQALDVVRANPDLFRVVALTAGGSNPELFEQQCAEFRPAFSGLGRRPSSEAAAMACDVVLNGITGAVYRRPWPRSAATTSQLANKESLIIGGPVVTSRAKPARSSRGQRAQRARAVPARRPGRRGAPARA